jgi:hypothetical protein
VRAGGSASRRCAPNRRGYADVGAQVGEHETVFPTLRSSSKHQRCHVELARPHAVAHAALPARELLPDLPHQGRNVITEDVSKRPGLVAGTVWGE